ncbi:MAG: outer membrane beta-barrel protein [Verrucomicrobia bacterium]|nr:outer membrane beta-barrel protein [Verrucomicrobiota bacterium]
MKLNKWTVALASAGVVSLASAVQAEERAMHQVATAVSATTLGGYVDTSAIWKFGTGTDSGAAGSEALPGRAFDGAGKTDGFNLHVVGLTLERPLGAEDWAAGYRVDLLFGPDAVAYNPSANGDATSDFGIKQAYVNLLLPAGNGIDVKMGVFNTIIGYESFESYLNPNFSRSFGWQLEPTQHTGVLASYQLSEALSVSGGVADTWSAGINARSPRAESHKAYMASIALTAPDSMGFMSGSSLYAGVVDGFSGNGKDTVSAYVGGSILTPIEGLGVGAAFDYRWNGNNGVTFDSNWAYAIAGYATFQATEKLKFAGRVDYTTGSDGTFFDAGAQGVSDEQNELFSFTATAEYALWANVITRAEFRWDNCLSDDKPYGQSDENALTLAANVIFKF